MSGNVFPAVAVLLVVAGMITILLIVGAIVGASIKSFYTELPVYQTRLQEHVSAFQSFLATKGIRGIDKVLLGYINPVAVMNLTASLLAELGSALSNIVLILLTVTFILLEASSFPIKLRAVLGDPQQTFPQFTRFVGDIERYMVIKTLISLATGILIGIPKSQSGFLPICELRPVSPASFSLPRGPVNDRGSLIRSGPQDPNPLPAKRAYENTFPFVSIKPSHTPDRKNRA